MQVKLYNSLTKKLEIFVPAVGNEVRMYSCGPTVYNYAHIGNMRAFLFADLLQRIMRTVGKYDMKWVMNITDIDDKTIRDSQKSSPAWLPEMGVQSDNALANLRMLTGFYTKAFIDDIGKLGINSEHFFAMPRATEFIGPMQELIRAIVEKGFGYVSDGSVYFDVAKWREADVYGKLKKIDFENFRPGMKIDTDQYEREQANDFVLWKARKENEPFWEFEINGLECPGRPGWHIECSCMEYELLGLPFDIHTGGIDLMFPHHEDEIAQSKAGYGIEPTNYWCHNEFLEVEGEKMSKSAGNFFTLRDLTEKSVAPVDIRFLMLSAHYKTKFNFTIEGLNASRKARLRVQEYIYELHRKDIPDEVMAIDFDLREKAFEELADDLHTPKALAHIFSFINKYPAGKMSIEDRLRHIEIFSDLNNVFEACQIGEKPEEKNEFPSEVIELAEKRLAAKKAKNWAESDIIRDQISNMGFAVKDTKDGYELAKK